MPLLRKANFPTLAVIMVFLLLLAGLIPSFFIFSDGVEKESFQQIEGDTVILKTPLEASLISVTNNPDEINVTLVDSDTGEINSSGPIELGNTTTLTLRDKQVNITYIEKIKSDEAIIKYEYPVFYEWNSVAVNFIRAVPVLVLLSFLYLLLILIQGDDSQ